MLRYAEKLRTTGEVLEKGRTLRRRLVRKEIVLVSESNQDRGNQHIYLKPCMSFPPRSSKSTKTHTSSESLTSSDSPPYGSHFSVPSPNPPSANEKPSFFSSGCFPHLSPKALYRGETDSKRAGQEEEG